MIDFNSTLKSSLFAFNESHQSSSFNDHPIEDHSLAVMIQIEHLIERILVGLVVTGPLQLQTRRLPSIMANSAMRRGVCITLDGLQNVQKLGVRVRVRVRLVG